MIHSCIDISQPLTCRHRCRHRCPNGARERDTHADVLFGPFLGLRLNHCNLAEASLVRNPGVDLGLFDELVH
jgi:hypothetical protein